MVTRRHMLIGGGVAAGLFIGWSLIPASFDNPMRADPNDAVLNTYIRIAPSGSITVAMPLLDMGQGESSLLAEIIAQEMGADWRTVAIEPAVPSPVYGNLELLKRWAPIIAPADLGASLAHYDYLIQRYAEQEPFMITAEATALANYLEPCREAGAGARYLLASAAANRWGTSWEECEVSGGMVRYGEQSLTFGEIAAEAANQTLPDVLPLRAELPGEELSRPYEEDTSRTEFPRLDLPAKVDGSVNFAADIRLPDMLYAAVRQGPHGFSKVKSFNRDAALKVDGVEDTIQTGKWVAVLGSNWWAANQGLTASRPVFISIGELADGAKLQQTLDTALREGKGYVLEKRGRGAAALQGDDAQPSPYTTVYRAQPALHTAVETAAATARFKDGRVEIWFAAQAPAQTAAVVADELGIDARNITIYPLPSGAAYGRALDHRPAIQAAWLAREAGRPVQLMWSRGEEQVQCWPRPPMLVRLTASTADDGAITTLQHKIAAPASGRQMMDRVFNNIPAYQAMKDHGEDFDRSTASGAIAPYAINNISVDHHPADLSLPTGAIRGDNEVINCFARESFIDEMARRAQREPLSYRVQMLGQTPQLVACMSQAAIMSGWDGGSDKSGQGLACHASGDALIAIIASAQRGINGVRVGRLSVAVDIGHVINPDIALQQIESGIVHGLNYALGGSSGYDEGLATARHLRDYNLPLLNDMPTIEIYTMPSTRRPCDADVIGIPAVAPAIANALFSATGFRFRQLPLI